MFLFQDYSDWIPHESHDLDVSLSSKEIRDNDCLLLWRCCTDIDAPPAEVLSRILYERHLWNRNVIQWHVVEKLHTNSDVFFSVVNIPGEEKDDLRECCELRLVSSFLVAWIRYWLCTHNTLFISTLNIRNCLNIVYSGYTH